MLERIKESGDIFMAWSDQPWILDGAAVRISIVGFDDGSESGRVLDGQLVELINANLSGSLDLSRAVALPENKGLAFMGLTLSGPFDIPRSTADELLSAPLNVNGRPNSDVVRPFLNGNDVAKRPRDYWVIDFGTTMDMESAAEYEAPFKYVLETSNQSETETIGRRTERSGGSTPKPDQE